MLDFFEYSRSDIAVLVRKCHYDEPASQDASHILAFLAGLSSSFLVSSLGSYQEPDPDSSGQHHRGPACAVHFVQRR